MTTAARGNGQAHGANGGNGGEAVLQSPERALLMADGNTLAPCVGCTLECFPRTCELFTEWRGLLERAPRGPIGSP